MDVEKPQKPRGGRPPRGHWSRRRHNRDGRAVAALDLGTNNCRLLIARPVRSGFRVVDGFSRIVRLGEGMTESGLLSDAAMDRAVEALKVCAGKVTRRRVALSRYVATEACRQAENCESFFDRVEDETGLRLEIIPSREEAELTLAGCLPLLDTKIPHGLVFDVGGGSAEILWLRIGDDGGHEILGWVSLPCGVVTMTERYGGSELMRSCYDTMVNEIVEMLRPFDRKYGISEVFADGRAQMLGTAGTVTTIAGLDMGLARYNRAAVDGCYLEFDAVRDISAMLVGASFAERAAHACIGEGRAELVVAGCGVLEAVCRTWPAGRLRVADRGVREGILLSLIDQVTRRAPPTAQTGQQTEQQTEQQTGQHTGQHTGQRAG